MTKDLFRTVARKDVQRGEKTRKKKTCLGGLPGKICRGVKKQENKKKDLFRRVARKDVQRGEKTRKQEKRPV